MTLSCITHKDIKHLASLSSIGNTKTTELALDDLVKKLENLWTKELEVRGIYSVYPEGKFDKMVREERQQEFKIIYGESSKDE